MVHFDIEVVSDTVCPWCYIGKQRLQQAIDAYKELHPGSNDTFSTTFMAFYLHPGASKGGIDKAAYYKSRYGEARTAKIFERLRQAGKEVNINFKFGGRAGNTRDSHRLIQLGRSKSPAIQTRVVEEVYAMFFENDGDITSHEHLTKAGVRAGLDEEEVRAWLASDQGGKAADEEAERAQMNQITGVPNFTIQGRYEVGGAQEPGVFLRLFEKIKAEQSSKA